MPPETLPFMLPSSCRTVTAIDFTSDFHGNDLTTDQQTPSCLEMLQGKSKSSFVVIFTTALVQCPVGKHFVSGLLGISSIGSCQWKGNCKTEHKNINYRLLNLPAFSGRPASKLY
jgi:hypothetical protein